MARGRDGFSRETILAGTIGTILFVAMAVGLIVTSVLWRQAVDASQVTVLTREIIISSPTDPQIVFLEGGATNLFCGSNVTAVVYPTFSAITVTFSGTIAPNATSSIRFRLLNVMPPGYLLPITDSTFNPEHTLGSGPVVDTLTTTTVFALYGNHANLGTDLEVYLPQIPNTNQYLFTTFNLFYTVLK